MTRDEAVDQVKEGLGFISSMTGQVISRMQRAQEDLERGRTLPPFMIREAQTLPLLANASSVDLPTDFLRRVVKPLPHYFPTGETKFKTIPWLEYDAAYDSFQADDVAGPKAAILRQSTIVFLPAADVNYTITWDYYQKGLLLTTNIENIWLANAPNLIIGDTGRRMAGLSRKKEAKAYFDQMYSEAARLWLAETVVQEQDDGPLFLGANA